MVTQFPPACACAPAPALLAWKEGRELRWLLNDAAREWPVTQHWAAPDWAVLAQAVMDEAERDCLEAASAALHVRWRASPLEKGWIAWLLPVAEDTNHTVAALRAQGMPPREHVQVAGDVGRLGVREPEIGVMLDDTESVRDARRRHAVSTQLGLAVGLVGIALWRVDLAAQRIHLNDRGYELLGYSPRSEGLTLDEVRVCIHPDDLPLIERALQLAVASHGVIDAEARYRRPGGGYYTLLTRRIAERDETGKPIALVGISLDISDQVQERERARQAAQSIELIAEATGVGVWTTDVDTRETVWNGQMWRIFGIPPEVPVPEARRMAIALTDPADREHLRTEFRRLEAGEGGAEEMEFRIRRSDGELRWVVGRGRFARHGERRLVFGVFIDVTEQRATQERLRRAEQRALLAAQSVGIAIWERDVGSDDTWWDAQMYRLRGLSPGDGRPPASLRERTVHPDDLRQVQSRLLRVAEGRGDYAHEFRVVWPDGSERWLATRGSLVRDEQGRPWRIVGVNWDITDQKRSEDMRREKAAAEQASQAKSEFLSRMSHELRTPLNAVLGFAQLMLGDGAQALPERQRERAQRIRNAGEHLLALIDDVLDLTSVEAGSVPRATHAVAVAPVVQETLQWLAPSAQEMGITLATSSLDGAVVADAKRLRQVLSNLLSNAVKYNRRGGRVEIDVMERRAEGEASPRFLGIRVRDTGRGLTPAQLARLFEPFNRLGAEREGIQGTGIGLTIVRALVDHMGGWVEVDSEAGQGSEFRVWLPRADENSVTEATDPNAPAIAAPVGDAVIDVLYIEDNPVNVMLVQELVAMRPSVRLHTAPDGRSGIARARELRPRAALIDLQLPDIDGFEVLRRLRAEPALQGLVCIALSANAMSEDIVRAKTLGFDDYWTKPINFGQFLDGLDRLASAH